MTYQAKIMEKKKPWLEIKTGQVKPNENIFNWRLQALHGKNLKEKTKIKNNGIYTI